MKAMIGAAIALFLLLLVWSPGPPSTPTAEPAPSPTPSLFASTVRPVLASRCAPCHEPGGKLYARLPFDDPEVVAAHAEGVLKRLHGEDREAVERWLKSRAPS